MSAKLLSYVSDADLLREVKKRHLSQQIYEEVDFAYRVEDAKNHIEGNDFLNKEQFSDEDYEEIARRFLENVSYESEWDQFETVIDDYVKEKGY